MRDLFVAMFREEWRIHAVLFGDAVFALLPVLVGAMAFMGTFLVPLVNRALPAGDLASIVHALYLLLGVMVGGFGLVGNEVMNRRFGQASFVAYAARTLPLSERQIFSAFVAKDTVYYLLFWVLPVVAGVAVASPFVGLPPGAVLCLLVSLPLSFLSGLSGLFLVTTVWSRSRAAFAVLAAVAVIAAGASVRATGGIPPFPPLALYRSFSWAVLAGTGIGIGAGFGVSLLLFEPRSPGGEHRHPDRFTGLLRRLHALPYPALTARDLLDLWRSGGGVGQVLFSLVLPLGLCWFLLSLLGPVLPPYGVLTLFSVLAGVLASTIYTWLTAFDSPGAYACLPVAPGDLIRSKLGLFALLHPVPAAIVLGAAVLSGNGPYAAPALGLMLGVSAWSAGIMVYLAGLSPNLLVYDPRVLFTYLFAVGLPAAGLIVLDLLDPWSGLAALLLVVPAVLAVRAAVHRWEEAEIFLS
ncbi:MAG TPA: hypothetical protein PK089_00685 [Methanoregulaceae archaeon]|nr:hypothetical protein [Methanoregulaceae archaeon]HQJ88049.1 hypothetical protein [Methanoregulaceae archaeon]